MRSPLKRIPWRFSGELHGVELVQFSIEPEEVIERVPRPLVPRLLDDRVVISLVNVDLRGMRPVFVPRFFSFTYRHLAFRLLVDDSRYDDRLRERGIFFLESFTDRALMVLGGALLTDYRLQRSRLGVEGNGVELQCGNRRLRYRKGPVEEAPEPPGPCFESWDRAHEIIGAIDRAYAVHDDTVRMTRIMRDRWPIEPLPIHEFETDFFDTARFECAFRIAEMIPYTWREAVAVKPSTGPAG